MWARKEQRSDHLTKWAKKEIRREGRLLNHGGEGGGKKPPRVGLIRLGGKGERAKEGRGASMEKRNQSMALPNRAKFKASEG